MRIAQRLGLNLRRCEKGRPTCDVRAALVLAVRELYGPAFWRSPDVRQLVTHGVIPKVPHANTLSRYRRNPKVAVVLNRMRSIARRPHVARIDNVQSSDSSLRAIIVELLAYVQCEEAMGRVA